MDPEVREYLRRMFDGVGQQFETVEIRIGARIDRLEEKLTARIDRVEERLSGVEERLSGVESRLDRVEERLSGVESRLEGVERRQDSAERWMETCGLTMTERFGNTNIRFDHVSGHLRDLESQLTLMNVQVEGVAKRVGIMAERMEGLEKQFEKMDSRAVGFSADVRDRFQILTERLAHSKN